MVFQVDKQDIGVVQDILLFIDASPVGHIVPASTDISMAPPDALPLHDHEVLDSNLSGNHFAYNLLKLVLIVLSSFVDTPRYSSGGDDLNDSILSQTFKKENTRLQIENGDLRAEKHRLKMRATN